MATTLTADCSVTTNSITVTFSEPIDQGSALTQSNYLVYDPPAFIRTPLDTLWTAKPIDPQTVNFTRKIGAFSAGDFVQLSISGVKTQAGDPVDPIDVYAQVPDTSPAGKTTRDVEDAISYPILTEEIGYRPSPVGIPSSGGIGGGGSSSLGQVAMKAVTDVLGWKTNNGDPKGFIGALTQAFTLTDVEGHVESKWVPRTYAVQTDLGGGITGAQASLYMRAKDALDQSLALLDGLYPLDPDADPEYVKALREMARSQMTEIVKEFGAVGLPSILRIDTYFNILLGQSPADIVQNSGTVQFDPDQIEGTLGQLRDTYGIYFANNPFNNTVPDEQDITNFRVISDYMTSLMQSWIANRKFFILVPDQLAFFGTQLVLISRQFNVIAETVNEVRFALDSVFIGPSERQTLLLEFSDTTLSPMFLEDVLVEVEQFVSDEGPRLLRDGGKISVTNNILPVVQSLQNMVEQAHSPQNINQLPDGFRTARVRNSLDDLNDQLEALMNLTEQVEQQVPPSLEKLVLDDVNITGPDGGTYTLALVGNNIQPGNIVTLSSATPVALSREDITFYSAQRIDVKIHPRSLGLEHGNHHIGVTNSNGESSTLVNALWYDAVKGLLTRGAKPVESHSGGKGGSRRAETRTKAASARKKNRHYPLAVTMDAGCVIGSAAPAPKPVCAPAATGRDVSFDKLSRQMDVHSQRITLIESRIVDIHTSITAKLEELSKKLGSQAAEGTSAAQRGKRKST